MEFPIAEGAVRTELETALHADRLQMGDVYRQLEIGVTDTSSMVENQAGANAGAVDNNRFVIEAILNGKATNGPSRARGVVRGASRLMKDNPGMSAATRSHLEMVREAYLEVAEDKTALKLVEQQAQAQSAELEKELETLGGVYVYTLPMYAAHPVAESPERYWLKVGKTNGIAHKRVKDQHRLTGLPEDPWLMRVYRHAEHPPGDLERTLHRLLIAAGHYRSSAVKGGTEWFATNLDFLDAVAEALGLSVEKLDLPD